VGTKEVYYSAVAAAAVDYAVGYNTNTLWYSVQANSVTYGFAWYGGTTSITTLSGTGAFATAGEVTAYSSDARLKLNVTAIPNALDKVLSIRGVTFDWDTAKADRLGFKPGAARDVGVIAQELQAVLPEAVRPAPFDWDAQAQISRSGDDYLTVQYEKITALLIEAVKELKAEVDVLKARQDSQ
jgi:hypothetical protein